MQAILRDGRAAGRAGHPGAVAGSGPVVTLDLDFPRKARVLLADVALVKAVPAARRNGHALMISHTETCKRASYRRKRSSFVASTPVRYLRLSPTL